MFNLLLTTQNPKREFYWRKLNPGDCEEVKNVVLHHFVKWEPLWSMLNITPETGGLEFTIDALSYLEDGQSICAYDPSNSNKIVGVFIISGPYSSNKKFSNCYAGKQKYVQLEQGYRILECMSIGPEKIVETYAGEEKFVKGLLVSVVEDYFRLGLGRALSHKSLELAKEAGCKYFFTELTSAYSAKIFEEAGAKVIKEILYSEYIDSVCREKIFAHCEFPHCSAKTAVIEL